MTSREIGPGVERTPCLLCAGEEADPLLESVVQLSPATGERWSFVRCRHCGLVYLDPRPTLGGMARYYPPDYLPFRGAAAWGRWEPLVRSSERRMDGRRARILQRALPTSADPATPPVVLDVGCGRPTFLEALHRRTGFRCVGIDPSDEGWSHEPERFRGLDLLRGTLEARTEELQSLAVGGFHGITLWHALEHEHDPLGLLRRLRTLAAPGAALLIEVPDFASAAARFQGAHWGGLHTPRHTAAWTPRTLRGALERAGWQVERQFANGTLDPWALWWLGRRSAKGDPLSGSQERRFPAFLLGKLVTLPLNLLRGVVPLGVQLALARPSRSS